MLYALTNFLCLQYTHSFFIGSQFYSFFFLFIFSLSFSFPRFVVLFFFLGFYFSICPTFKFKAFFTLVLSFLIHLFTYV